MPPRSASRHSQVHLALPTKTSGCRHPHTMLPVKTQDHRQLLPAHPVGASSRRQSHGALARKFKGVDVSGAEMIRVLPLVHLQASARKSIIKKAVKVPSGDRIGTAAQQQRLLKRGKWLTSHLSHDVNVPDSATHLPTQKRSRR